MNKDKQPWWEKKFDEIVDKSPLTLRNRLNRPIGWHIGVVALKRLAKQIERRARLEVLERVKLETDAVVCDCGEKWDKSDLAEYINKEIANLTTPSDEKE